MSIKIKVNFDTKKGMKQINRLIDNLNKVERKEIQYGYFDGKLHNSGLERSNPNITEAALMLLLHEGSRTAQIPPRPVFRLTGQNMKDQSNKSVLLSSFRKLLNSVVNSVNVHPALRDIGEIMKKATQDNFGRNSSVNLEENAERTQQLKGRNDPLVDSGKLRDAMKVRIKE